jgi:uncharacterized alkaline shock family protein YloU
MVYLRAARLYRERSRSYSRRFAEAIPGLRGERTGNYRGKENSDTEENAKMSELDQRRFESPLVSERGVTTIKDTVVSRIAGMAAREVEGVHMGGSASRTTGGILESITGSEAQTRGVSVEVGRTEVAIDLKMGIEYGKNILQTVDEVRRRITDRVQNMTGLKVVECNATITDIVFPDEEGRGEEDGRRRELESGPGYEELEARPQVRRTEEIRTQEREAEDTEATYTATRETSSTESDTRRGTTEEVRVEGEPLEGDETAELRPEDDETYRDYRDRRREEP